MLRIIRDYFNPLPVLTTTPDASESFNPKGVSIRQMRNGRFRLLENGNEVVATYARRRDAVRGAARRGLTLT